MDGTAAIIAQAIIGLGTMGGTISVISRWAGKLDSRLAGVERLAAEAVPRHECTAIMQGHEGHFDQVEDRIHTLEDHLILPREVDAMQKAYKDALGTLAGNMDQRFGRLEVQITQLSSEVSKLNGGSR